MDDNGRQQNGEGKGSHGWWDFLGDVASRLGQFKGPPRLPKLCRKHGKANIEVRQGTVDKQFTWRNAAVSYTTRILCNRGSLFSQPNSSHPYSATDSCRQDLLRT
jgi:hypothetical protein